MDLNTEFHKDKEIKMKNKIIAGVVILGLATSMANAGVLGKIAQWIWKYRWGIVTVATIAPNIVSAAGYEDDDIEPASKDIAEALENGEIYYNFRFCTSSTGKKIAVGKNYKVCPDGSYPQDGLTINLQNASKE